MQAKDEEETQVYINFHKLFLFDINEYISNLMPNFNLLKSHQIRLSKLNITQYTQFTDRLVEKARFWSKLIKELP
jgi:hypothetical protein